MRATEVWAKCIKEGVQLEPQGDRLRFYGPKQVLTPELQDELRANKSALLELLRIVEVFKSAGIKGTVLQDSRRKENDRTPSIMCPYQGNPRPVYPEVCEWHCDERDQECDQCKNRVVH